LPVAARKIIQSNADQLARCAPTALMRSCLRRAVAPRSKLMSRLAMPRQSANQSIKAWLA